MLAAVLSLTSFTFYQPSTKAALPFCEGVQLVLKKIKSGEALSKKDAALASGSDMYESEVKLTGFTTSTKEDSYGTLFVVEAGNDTDALVKQKKFAEIKTQLIKCLNPKKIDVNDSDYFSFEVGTIIIELVREKSGLVKNYGVSLWIQKPKK